MPYWYFFNFIFMAQGVEIPIFLLNKVQIKNVLKTFIPGYHQLCFPNAFYLLTFYPDL